jgi:hypothetical protein
LFDRILTCQSALSRTVLFCDVVFTIISARSGQLFFKGDENVKVLHEADQVRQGNPGKARNVLDERDCIGRTRPSTILLESKTTERRP